MILVERKLINKILPQRIENSHKGSYGKVAVICGSEEMPGASRLVSRGAYIAGAGLVRSYAGKSFAPYLKNDIPEVIVKTIHESLFNTFPEDLYKEIGKEIEDHDVTVFGCGVGKNIDLENTVVDLVANNKKILIIDGDGINLLKDNKKVFAKNQGDIILTPHPKEFSRLTGVSIEEIVENKEKLAAEFSVEHRVFLLLKGKNTIITSPKGDVYLDVQGNSALSKGGTGDVLSGFIAGFAAQGTGALQSMLISAYLHGKCGELASKDLTEYSVMASDLITYLPRAIISLQGGEVFV